MIAVIGAGIGGLVAAIALRKIGVDVIVFEQASAFGRIGAGITLTPNAVKVLDGLGLGDAVRETAHVAAYRISRTWDSGEVTSKVALGNAALERYGAPSLMLHRADLLSALEAAIPDNSFKLNKKLVGLRDDGDTVEMTFADGSTDRTEGVIGADGIHSVVRSELFEADDPVFTGMSAYRSIIPVARLDGLDVAKFVKWWGPNLQVQIVTNALSRSTELYIFATIPEATEVRESWSMEGNLDAFKSFFAGFHAEARAVINACEDLLRTALYERAPLDHWSKGRVTLLGDACHAMTPFMAQGAAMGLEDAAVLSRCVEGSVDWPTALVQYEKTRLERASEIQLASHQNNWLRDSGNPDWVYGYDAWSADLA